MMPDTVGAEPAMVEDVKTFQLELQLTTLLLFFFFQFLHKQAYKYGFNAKDILYRPTLKWSRKHISNKRIIKSFYSNTIQYTYDKYKKCF